MAKINIEFDTMEKTLMCSLDGKEIMDVCGVNIYSGWDDMTKYRCSIMTKSENEETDIETMTTMMAEQKEIDEEVKKFFEKQIDLINKRRS